MMTAEIGHFPGTSLEHVINVQLIQKYIAKQN